VTTLVGKAGTATENPSGSRPVASPTTAADRTPSPGVRLAEVRKLYGTVEGLSGVSMEIDPGSFTVLLGPSGSGKSTLLRCVAGIERLSSGRIEIAGRMVASDGVHVAAEKRNLAMVFQDYALWPHMRARENVAFALRRLHLDRSEERRRALGMLDAVGLGAMAERYPSELSGGEQQRVALARALVARPGLALFDEPLSNLDTDLRDRLRVEISTLVREAGSTAIYITHDQAEAFALADQVGVLERGRLVQCAPPEEVYAAPATPFVARFTGLSGELAGRVVDSSGAERLRVRVGDAELVVSDRHPERAVVGADTLVLVRPAAARFAGPSEGSQTLAAVVVDSAFRGRGYEHVVETPAGQRLGGIAHDRRQRPGTPVDVALDPGGCHAYPAAPR
jgi:iron(III) transport system ATP-binding protein